MSLTADIIIIGGGIVGFATALELQNRHPKARLVLLEKEPRPAQHQSRFNSGVIHAGVYYAPGSLKAQFCREGVVATQNFCDEFGIRYETPGKLIVATDEDEAQKLGALYDRARANGIPIEHISAAEIHKAEPHITGVAGLLSPSTGIVSYAEMTEKMRGLFVARGGEVRFGARVTNGIEDAAGVRVRTRAGEWQAGHLIACAGLHSDRIIRAFGHSPDFHIIPFRGEFFALKNQPENLARHLIYPVPDPARPFLGVHITKKLSGQFTVGPNAVLAFKREGYRLRDISPGDLAENLAFAGFWRMLMQNFAPAMSELAASVSRRNYLRRVQKYCPRVRLADLAHYPAGVRAQAVSRQGAVIDDFLFVPTPKSLHVGNAPSPAATAAIPIARHIADKFAALG